jgi:signal transduction histidine kinase
LSNIARHAHATAATVCVAATDGQLCLTLRYNGIGVTAIDPRGDWRRHINRRAQQLGGYATIRSAGDEKGTVVEWVIALTTDTE